MTPTEHDTPAFIPAAPAPLVARAFAWWVGRQMLPKSFYALRLSADTANALADHADHPGPLVCVTNHASWWDPLVMLYLHRTQLDRGADVASPEARPIRAPMDAAELARMRFFTKLGVFGLNPDDPAALARMHDYLTDEFDRSPRLTLWITPQGRFADVRAPVEIRPGVARIAASRPGVRVVAVAIEYAMWNDRRPEIFCRFDPVTPQPARDGSLSTTRWHRAIRGVMNDNAAELARRVIARDPDAFVTLVGGAGASINPIMDAWLKLRGKSRPLDDRRARHAEDTPSTPGSPSPSSPSVGQASRLSLQSLPDPSDLPVPTEAPR